MSVAPTPALPIPGPVVRGRHRRHLTAGDRVSAALMVAARVGSLVTLAALLVVAGAVGGLVDGTPADETTVTTATLGDR